MAFWEEDYQGKHYYFTPFQKISINFTKKYSKNSNKNVEIIH